ncbi:MAG: hypothetical protein K5891_02755 [Lachnospiraceae bacterium]|nr:hypothetical protein [Lachnospiraceae bacterium]
MKEKYVFFPMSDREYRTSYPACAAASIGPMRFLICVLFPAEDDFRTYPLTWEELRDRQRARLICSAEDRAPVADPLRNGSRVQVRDLPKEWELFDKREIAGTQSPLTKCTYRIFRHVFPELCDPGMLMARRILKEMSHLCPPRLLRLGAHFLLTHEKRIGGVCALAYPGLLEELAAKWQAGYYLKLYHRDYVEIYPETAEGLRELREELRKGEPEQDPTLLPCPQIFHFCYGRRELQHLELH